jgi:ribosomal protein S18 acetylase RimI-like enzyme
MKSPKLMKIKYLEKDKTGLDIIQLLWEKLKEHHKARSVHFKNHFAKITWETRKTQILEKTQGGALFVHLAKDSDTDKIVGYCVTSIDDKKVGEIESIFIESKYRRAGIGDYFMKRSLEWMDAHTVSRKVIAVAAGNEEVFGFYARFNFYPRVNILVQPDKK